MSNEPVFVALLPAFWPSRLLPVAPAVAPGETVVTAPVSGSICVGMCVSFQWTRDWADRSSANWEPSLEDLLASGRVRRGDLHRDRAVGPCPAGSCPVRWDPRHPGVGCRAAVLRLGAVPDSIHRLRRRRNAFA